MTEKSKKNRMELKDGTIINLGDIIPIELKDGTVVYASEIEYKNGMLYYIPVDKP